MLRTISIAAAGLVALPATASGLTPATAVPPDSIRVAFVAGQQLGGPDPSKVATEVTVTGIDCSIKCELHGIYSFRQSGDDVLLATWRGNAGTVKKARDRIDVDDGWDHDYVVYRTKPGGGDEVIWANTSAAWAVPDGAATIGTGFRRELDLQATETMVLRSSTRGAKATFPRWSDGTLLYGIVAEKSPNAGVVKAVAGGVTLATIDLKGAAVAKRAVVGTVKVPAGQTLQLVNATPAGRSSSRVGIDSLIGMYAPSPNRTGAKAQPSRGPARTLGRHAAGESISYTVPDGQLPASGGVPLDLVVKVKGCAGGCQIFRVMGDSGTSTLVWSKTSPASTTLQTIHVPVVAPFANWGGVYYTLRKGGTYVDSAEVTPNKLEQNYVGQYAYNRLTYSYGWSQDSMASATGGAIMRSSTPGTGMTYRVLGEFEGRRVSVVAARGRNNGIMKIYNNAVLVKTLDLYAASWQPRQVVATFDTPLKGRITVVNATPATRPNKDIHIDALIVFGGYDDWWRTAKRS